MTKNKRGLSLSLIELNEWPDELYDVPAVLIEQVLSQPTLIHLPGGAAEPIFVSVLLHGDEDVGLKAIQQVLSCYRGQVLPRSLSIFIGNVAAATAGVRFLPHQLDYNRVWPHAQPALSRPEHRLMLDVFERMADRRVAASIDLHNNTGLNPYYSCLCSLEPEHLQLAALFGMRAMYFTRPLGVQTAAFSRLCPSITCECGPIGDAGGVQAAAQLIERLMSLGSGELRELLPAVPATLELYRTVGTWRILPQATLDFNSRSRSTVFLRPDLDRLNFQSMAAGTELGQVSVALNDCMEVCDEHGQVVTDQFLTRDPDGTVRLKCSVTPSMFTTSLAAIRQDCVGYFLGNLSAADRSSNVS